MIELNTERLIIRDHLRTDLASHHSILSDSESMYYLEDIQTHSLDDSEHNLTLAIDEMMQPIRRCWFFRIEDKTKRHIGEIGYTVLEHTPVGSVVEVGYFLRKEFWGNGYATEALKEVMQFAFLVGGVFRITAGCCKENIGSELVMIKCGLTKEGEYKQVHWHDGKMKDRVCYRMLKDEWLAIYQQRKI